MKKSIPIWIKSLKTVVTIGFIACTFSFYCNEAHSQSNYRDNSFSQDGMYEDDNGFSAQAGSFGMNGSGYFFNKILPNGETIFLRISKHNNLSFVFSAKTLSDGSINTSYGMNGAAVAAFDNPNMLSMLSFNIKDVFIQPNGKIIIVTTVNAGQDWLTAVYRLNADGDADYGFGQNGGVILGTFCSTGLCQGWVACSAFLNNQGNIYLVGYGITAVPGSPGVFNTVPKAIRLNNNGTTDLTLASLSQYFENFFSVCEIQGKIYVSGTSYDAQAQVRVFDILGQPDLTFGGQGTGIHETEVYNAYSSTWINRYPIKLLTDGASLFFISADENPGDNSFDTPFPTNVNLFVSKLDALGMITDFGPTEFDGYVPILHNTSFPTDPNFTFKIENFKNFSVSTGEGLLYTLAGQYNGGRKIKIAVFNPPFTDFELTDVPQSAHLRISQSVREIDNSFLITGSISVDLFDVNCNAEIAGLIKLTSSGSLQSDFGENGINTHHNLFQMEGPGVSYLNSISTSAGERLIFSGTSGDRQRDIKSLNAAGNVTSQTYVQQTHCAQQENKAYSRIYYTNQDYIFSTDSSGRIAVYNSGYNLVNALSNSLIYTQLPSLTINDQIVIKEYNQQYYIFVNINGGNGTSLSIFRLNPDLTFDLSFGSSGTGFTSLLGADYQTLYGHFINEDGIFVVGLKNASNLSKVFLMKFFSNGNPDVTFGDYGNLIVETENSISVKQTVNVDNIWIYVNASYYNASSNSSTNKLFRMDFNGQKDLSFGTSGYQIFEPLQIESMIYNDGFIYFVDSRTTFDLASLTPCSDCRSKIARMDLSGAFDNNFLIEEMDYAVGEDVSNYEFNNYNPFYPVTAPSKKFASIRFNHDSTKIYAFGYFGSGLNNKIFRFCLTPCSIQNSTDAASSSNGNLNVFPNPSPGTFTVSFPSPINVVRVFDALGRLVHEPGALNGMTLPMLIDLSNNSDGIYFLQAVNDKETVTVKIVKQK